MKVRDITPEWIVWARDVEWRHRHGFFVAPLEVTELLDSLAVAIPALQEIEECYGGDVWIERYEPAWTISHGALDTEVGES